MKKNFRELLAKIDPERLARAKEKARGEINGVARVDHASPNSPGCSGSPGTNNAGGPVSTNQSER
jgi:hypothetical protein